MLPARSLRTTFSQVSGLVPMLARSSVSSVSPAVFNFWLWQVTQYLSSVARAAIPGVVAVWEVCACAHAAEDARIVTQTEVNRGRAVSINYLPFRLEPRNFAGTHTTPIFTSYT